MKVEWRASAIEQFDAIVGYIAERNSLAAADLVDRVESITKRLGEFPHMHRAGRVSGTREAIAHPNYVVVYRILSDQVEILSVLHARQRYP